MLRAPRPAGRVSKGEPLFSNESLCAAGCGQIPLVSGLVATGWSLASFATGLGIARSAHADLHCISVVVCHRDVVSSYCTRVITASSATDHLVAPATPECHPSSQFTSTRDPWSGAEARACLRASVAGLSHGCPRLSPLARAVAVGVRGARGLLVSRSRVSTRLAHPPQSYAECNSRCYTIC